MESLNISGWYIFYTRPLQEKKVANYFSQKRVKNYCPVKNVKSQYSGPFQVTYEPLFKSFVFVHIASLEYSGLKIKMISEAINLLYWLEKPAVIRNEEIEAIKKFLGFYKDVELEKIPVSANGTIAVMYSPVRTMKSMMPETTMGFVKMRLPSLGYALKARVSRELIKWTDILQLTNCQQLPVTKFAS